MNRGLPLVALAVVALAHRPGFAAGPLAPTGRWVVDFAAHQCTAARNYGPEDKPVDLVLKYSPTGTVMQLAIIRGGRTWDIGQSPVTITLDRGPPIDASLLSFSPKKSDKRVELINLPIETFAAVRQATNLSISGKGRAQISFALSMMTPLMSAMDTCLADLQEVWNVGGAGSAKVKQAAQSKSGLASFFNPRDYPGDALSRGQSGTVGFTFLIDETGKIADCTVIATSGVALLDSQSCAILVERAKFNPAVGIDGKPVKSSSIQRVRWDLE
ncbi:MAG: energy transducer TonB [Pseudomonadota bacterium]|nr:energy transducer TonB [Pseudomonadota bacterium]